MALFLWPCMKYAFYDAAGDGDGCMEVQCIPLKRTLEMRPFLLPDQFSGGPNQGPVMFGGHPSFVAYRNRSHLWTDQAGSTVVHLAWPTARPRTIPAGVVAFVAADWA